MCNDLSGTGTRLRNKVTVPFGITFYWAQIKPTNPQVKPLNLMGGQGWKG